MQQAILDWIKDQPIKGKVLEVGSLCVEGQEEVANLRPLFPDTDWLGIDLRHGPGVDHVCDAEYLPFGYSEFDTVVCCETLEHVKHPWKAVEGMFRVLKPYGKVFISVPFIFQIHDFPNDYWRFSPEGLRILLEDAGFHAIETRGLEPGDMPIRVVGTGHVLAKPESMKGYRGH